MDENDQPRKDLLGIAQMAFKSIEKCDSDLKINLYNNCFFNIAHKYHKHAARTFALLGMTLH